MSHTLFATYTGKLIDYRNFKEEDVYLEDIAHHLTNIQRFGGCLPFNKRYSVASHSLNCYKMAKMLHPGEIDLHRSALLHDSSEAYLGDMVSGLKRLMSEYEALERSVLKTIFNKWKIEYFTRVSDIDKRIMLDEVKALMPHRYELYFKHQQYLPYDHLTIIPDYYPDLIKHDFLNACEEVGIYD
jgi:uncharacterized protein